MAVESDEHFIHTTITGGLLKSKSKFKPALRNDLPIKKNTVFISVFGLGSMENVFLPVELHTRSGLHAAVD